MDNDRTNDSDRVWYDEMREAFVGKTIEREGIKAEVEAVIGNSDSPKDDFPRYSLEVRTYFEEED